MPWRSLLSQGQNALAKACKFEEIRPSLADVLPMFCATEEHDGEAFCAESERSQALDLVGCIYPFPESHLLRSEFEEPPYICIVLHILN
jgi:hypothetical protein